MMMKKSIVTLFALLLALGAFTQDTVPMQAMDEGASGMRADGKIYVVVAVLVTILAGLFLYVFRLDRKISRMEKNQ